jgi:hypothetical protein
MLNNFSATLNIKCPLFSSCSKVMVPDGNGLNDGMLFYGAGTTQANGHSPYAILFLFVTIGRLHFAAVPEM